MGNWVAGRGIRRMAFDIGGRRDIFGVVFRMGFVERMLKSRSELTYDESWLLLWSLGKGLARSCICVASIPIFGGSF